MRTPEELLLDELAQPSLTLASLTRNEISISTLLNLYRCIDADGKTLLHAALKDVLSRLLEVAIVREPTLATLARRWNALAAQADTIIEERLKDLCGVSPPRAAVVYVKRVVGGTALQRGRKMGAYETLLPELFRRATSANLSGDLRCAICGYHFCETDTSEQRRSLAVDEGSKFAAHPHPKRLDDRLKPLLLHGRADVSLCQLTVDHVVPEEGLGSSDVENLEIVCSFCNQGKLAYRRPLEPVSLFGVGGYFDYPESRPLGRVAQIIIVATLRASQGQCATCRRTTKECELLKTSQI